jgi:hypothetical protein
LTKSTPAEILLEDFMKPMGVSARQLAADIDVSPSRIIELVNVRRPYAARSDRAAYPCFPPGGGLMACWSARA